MRLTATGAVLERSLDITGDIIGRQGSADSATDTWALIHDPIYSGSTRTTVAEIEMKRTSTGAGNYDGQISLQTRSTGNSLAEALLLDKNQGASFRGAIVVKTSALSANTTLGAHYAVFASAAGGSITLTLPAASGNAGLVYEVYKTDTSTNTVTVDGNASETIGGALTVVLGGNKGVSRLLIICDGSNWQLKELYEEGDFTATLTGVTTSVTGTARYTLNGKTVSLDMVNLLGTSNSTACTITGVPATIRPARNKDFSVNEIQDNGNKYPGMLRLASSGTFTLFFLTTVPGALGSTFTNANQKGLGMDTALAYNLM